MAGSNPTTVAFAVNRGVQLNENHQPLLLIKNTPPRGLGVFANTDIRQGSCMLIEDSVLYFTQHKDADGDLEIDEDELTAQYQNLPAAVQQDLMALHTPNDDGKGHTPLKRIAAVNSYDAESVDGMHRSRLSLFFSRTNHSCAPNAIARFRSDVHTGRIVLHAATDIPKDTEITFNYLDDDWEGVGHRRRTLRKHYGFDCACRLCMKAGRALKQVEERRTKLRDDWEKFGLKTGKPSSSPAAEQAGGQNDRVTGPANSMAEPAGDFCLEAIRELNDFPECGGQATLMVDIRIFRTAQTAATNFETLAEIYDTEDKLESAAKAWHWVSKFTELAIIVGKICYGDEDVGPMPQHPTVRDLIDNLEDCYWGDRRMLTKHPHPYWMSEFEHSEATLEMRSLLSTRLRLNDIFPVISTASEAVRQTEESQPLTELMNVDMTGYDDFRAWRDTSDRFHYAGNCLCEDGPLTQTQDVPTKDKRKLSRYGLLPPRQSTRAEDAGETAKDTEMMGDASMKDYETKDQDMDVDMDVDNAGDAFDRRAAKSGARKQAVPQTKAKGRNGRRRKDEDRPYKP